MSADNLHSNTRVAKNTLYLYFRTLFVMGVTIFTSRIILDALGIEDYGIYNVVGGFVSMFSVLSGTLTVASQRFIAYELGKENPEIKKVFSTTVSIHILLAFIILVILESVGIWFLNCKMNIAPERLYAANWVFQCSVITFCINIISIPYNAAIIAYEKMSAFAYISIFEVVAKLVSVYALYMVAFDSLIIYAVLMLFVAVILRVLYGVYCNYKFKECRYILSLEKNTFKEMLGFSGWNFIGSSAAILNGQGINMLINIFFGVTLNAARGVATQVDTAINTFVQNFMMALNPQITKSYAAGDFEHVNKMIIFGTKFAFFLFWILCLPIYLNTDFILNVWLNKVPKYTAVFVQLSIIYTLCQNLSQCLYTAMLATGRIKKYQITVGGLSLLAFPMTWIFFKMGFPVELGYWSMIFFSIVCFAARLYLLQTMIPLFSGWNFIKKVIAPIFYTIVPTVIVIYIGHQYIMETTWKSFIVESLGCIVICCIAIFYLGLTQKERDLICRLVVDKIKSK
ncbi:MAG: oligosaccharide flippase family protein [Bacteroides sp.]|nr:oligosaccharide flippase family protein [Roseburia sp.]MCM1346155.1 oligosaccharide flippase family protein [Bacteroides sp.]MCM1439887.1 oligosaccharide flippase family protein [Roseburia sp.]